MKALTEEVKRVFPSEPPEWVYSDPRDMCSACLNTGVVIKKISLAEFYKGKVMPIQRDPNDEVDVAEPCQCAEFRAKERRFGLAVGDLPGALMRATLGGVNRAHDYKVRALREAEVLADGVLVFAGPTGLGKTYVAVAALRKVIDAGRTGAFITSRELCDNLRERAYDTAAAREYLADLRGNNLVVLDDFGRERLGGAEGSVLSWYAELLNGYEKGGALIITTNLDFVEALKETFGNESAPIMRRLAPKLLPFGGGAR